MSDITLSFSVEEGLQTRLVSLAQEQELSLAQLLKNIASSYVSSAEMSYETWLTEKIKLGLADAEAGNLVAQEEVSKMFASLRQSVSA